LESLFYAFKGVSSTRVKHLTKPGQKICIFLGYCSPSAGDSVSQASEVMGGRAMLSGQKARDIRALSSWGKHSATAAPHLKYLVAQGNGKNSVKKILLKTST